MQQRQQKWNKQMQTCSVYNKDYTRNNCIKQTANIANKHQQPTSVSVHDNQHVPSLQTARARDITPSEDVALARSVSLQPLMTINTIGPLTPAQVTAHPSCHVNNTAASTETADTSVTGQQQVQQPTSDAIAADVEPEFSVQESMDTVTGLSCMMQIETTELINKFYSELREAQKLDPEPKHLVTDLNDLNFVLNKE